MSSRRRFSDAFLDKLHLKPTNNSNKKVLENQSKYKTKVIKYTPENRSISIDQVFVYADLIKVSENKNKLNPLDEEEEESEDQSNGYLDLFRQFKSKFFIIKISIHEAFSKKKLGKLEVFIDFMNLNLNPFATFMQELIPINKTENEEQLSLEILTPKFVNTFFYFKNPVFFKFSSFFISLKAFKKHVISSF